MTNRFHYRVITVMVDGTEVRGQRFNNLDEALVEVGAMNNYIAACGDQYEDIAEVKLVPVMVR